MIEDLDVHPELAARGSFAHLALGKLPRKNDPRTLKLAKYLTAPPEYPDHVDWTAGVASWPMYGNDSLGDCTIAAAGHMIQAWTQGAGAPVTPDETAVVDGYWATGSDDSGRFELDVLNYWRANGIAGHEILAYVQVDPQNLDHVRYAIATFGGVYTGAALPLSAQGQAKWSVVGDGHSGASAPASWGGHAIPYLAYDVRTQDENQGGDIACITWGSVLLLTEAWHLAYCDELYAIVTKDWVAANGATPTGLNLDALLADLHVVEASETPAGITVGGEDDGVFRLRVPEFPWEIRLNSAVWWIQEMPDGSIVVKFSPANSVPGRGAMPMPPATSLVFSNPEAWQNFVDDVNSKGEASQERIRAAQAAAALAVPPGAGSPVVLPRG